MTVPQLFYQYTRWAISTRTSHLQPPLHQHQQRYRNFFSPFLRPASRYKCRLESLETGILASYLSHLLLSGFLLQFGCHISRHHGILETHTRLSIDDLSIFLFSTIIQLFSILLRQDYITWASFLFLLFSFGYCFVQIGTRKGPY